MSSQALPSYKNLFSISTFFAHNKFGSNKSLEIQEKIRMNESKAQEIR